MARNHPYHSNIPAVHHASKKWGGQRDSNPQQPEPQSGALPLSYDHRLIQILGLRFAIAKAKVGAGLAQASRIGRLLCSAVPQLAHSSLPATLWCFSLALQPVLAGLFWRLVSA